jgi:hypothetical protein
MECREFLDLGLLLRIRSALLRLLAAERLEGRDSPPFRKALADLRLLAQEMEALDF